MSFSIQHLYRNSVALLVVAFVVVLTPSLTAVSYLQQRAAASQVLTTQAHMAAFAMGADNRIDNTDVVRILPELEANPDYILACVYDTIGTLKAYRRGPAHDVAAADFVSCEGLANYRSSIDHLVISTPVIRANLPEPIGELVVVGKGPSAFSHLGIWFGISVLLGLMLAMFCWMLGMRLQSSLIKPLRQIGSTAQRVSLYKDYTLRVVPGVLDVVPQEIQALTDSFNAMLKEIEDRDSRLSRKSVELEKAREVAVSADSAKSQFLANVSHELRTPLNAIIGFSAMLEKEQFGPIGNPKYVEYSRDIQDSGRHLLDVINDILDLTKAESGKLSVVFSSLALSKIVEKALRIVAGEAHTRKVDVYTDIPAKLPKIIADPVRLVQILLNLLNNSIKFSEPGGKVIVSARAEAGRGGVMYFTITIEDKGIGMTDAEIRKAFSTFNQADAGLNRKYDGAGLGLPLTKRLVDLHHGKIKIESEKGKGTIVTVRLTSDPALLD